MTEASKLFFAPYKPFYITPMKRPFVEAYGSSHLSNADALVRVVKDAAT